MATILVMGDSWSTTQFSDNPHQWGQSWYPAHLSLVNRLRSLGHTAYELAWGGASMLHQMERLDKLSHDCLHKHPPFHKIDQHIDYIVLGWTEWTRDTELWSSSALNHSLPQVYPSLEDNYAALHQSHSRAFTLRLSEFTNQYPRIRWLHWGGLADVWAKVPRKNHRVLYPNYASYRVQGYPGNPSSLLTYAPRFKSIRVVRKWVDTVFPNTPKPLAQQLAEHINKWCDFTAAHPQVLPDGGHFAFELYDHLAAYINSVIVTDR